ncbi:MAG: H-NS histone family protein [Rhodocyclaceae bacterium]|nr:H-NS histone family protein [Rhodocyclaceae bacterium]
MDLSKLTINELLSLVDEINIEIARKKKVAKSNALNAVKALAESQGYSLEELLNISVAKGNITKTPVAVKYRHPKKSELAWTGRGRTPKWVTTWLAEGGTLEALKPR